VAVEPYLEALAASGAELDGAGRPASFGDVPGERDAAMCRAVLADRSDAARIDSAGRDILDLLHRLSTQDLKDLTPGLGRATVLTTPKGRIVERLFILPLAARSTLLVGGRVPGTAQKVLAHLARFTFAEDTALADVTAATRQIVLLGPAARTTAAAAGLPAPAPLACTKVDLAGIEVSALGLDGDGGPGISLVVAAAAAPALWSALVTRLKPLGVRPAGDQALEARRVALGLPAPGAELTEEHNPLEAGLWNAVSFTKGCYVGQEVVARLRTYDKVSKHLVGLIVDGGAPPPPVGAALARDGRTVGTVTSSIPETAAARVVALAFVKRDAAGAGTRLTVASPPGAVVVHSFAEPAASA